MKPSIIILAIILGLGSVAYFFAEDFKAIKRDASDLNAPKYACKVTLEIAPINGDAGQVMSKEDFEAHAYIISSEEFLKKALESHALSELRGKHSDHLLKEISDHLKILHQKGTNIITLEVVSDSGDSAEQIATAITKAYSEHRREQSILIQEGLLAKLKETERLQELKVKEHKRRLDELRKKLGIPDETPQKP